MTDGAVVEMPVDESGRTDKKQGILDKLKSLIGLKGVVVEEEVLTVDMEFISRVLPHRGRWLLLERVSVAPAKVTGFYTVSDDVCAGHAIGDDAVLPGVLLAEMANQLVGIWYAVQNPELIGSDKVLFARTGSYKASSFIRPGDLLRCEVECAKLAGTMKTTRRGTLMEITGEGFLFKVGDDLKGSVSKVELKGIEPPKKILLSESHP